MESTEFVLGIVVVSAVVMALLLAVTAHFIMGGLMLGTAAVARIAQSQVGRVTEQQFQEIEDYANRKDGDHA